MPSSSCASCSGSFLFNSHQLNKCHACDAMICTACLDENAARTYPDGLPYCPNHKTEEPHAEDCPAKDGFGCRCV